VAGHAGQITDQSELVFDGRSIGDQPGVIDVAFVDGSSRIEMAQVCPVEFLKRWMEMAIAGLQAVFSPQPTIGVWKSRSEPYAAQASTGTTGGSRTVKAEPLPGSLAASMSPPISRASRRLIASPRPVPPYRRLPGTPAWLKS